MIRPERLTPHCDSSSLELLRTALSRFDTLSEQAWEDALARLYEYRLNAGEFFLQAGDIPQFAGFVVTGVLREFFITFEGQEFNKGFSLEGEFTGSLFDLIAAEPSTASIEALAPTALIVCRFTDLQDLYARYPDWERVGRLLAESLFMQKARREQEFMTLSAEQRYVLLLQTHPDLEKRVSQYHLASYLGISPVSLSRIRRHLGRPKLR